MSSTVKSVAREAESNPVLEAAARAGYAANGVVHILIGGIVFAIAFGGQGESDQSGALKAVADAPLGFVLLWLIAVALWALGLWHAFEGILIRDRPGAAGTAKKWGRRIGEWGQAAIFIALGVLAASVALGARPNSEQAAEDASGGLLAVPGGPIVLGLVGLGIGIGGIAFVVMGVMRSFRKKLSMPDGVMGGVVTTLGVVGFVAKGVALAIVGVLLIIAAVRLDPQTAGGLEGAIQALLDVMFGPFLVGVVGGGFVAYGVFCLFRARYARL